ncbi:MAG: thymidylate synthase [Minisyncoccales bacterium]|jgi:thymidylate synthase
MKLFEQRIPDSQYGDMLKKILYEGRDVLPIHGEKAKMIAGAQLRYDIDNGFPVITERDLSGSFFKNALAEHIGFLNGARTQDELEQFGCNWWKRWVTKEKCEIFGLPEGDLGDGSYGAAWATFPTTEGDGFNQIKEVIRQLKERPYLRTHFISPWIPQYAIQHSDLKRKVVVAPCHGWIHILAFPEAKELSIHHFQRSADFPVGVPFNIIQYAAFGLMVAQLIDYKLKEVIYTFSDAHIYESQIDYVKDLISREPRRLPTVELDPEINDIFDFRPEHFTLKDYDPHSKMMIPTPI